MHVHMNVLYMKVHRCKYYEHEHLHVSVKKKKRKTVLMLLVHFSAKILFLQHGLRPHILVQSYGRTRFQSKYWANLHMAECGRMPNYQVVNQHPTNKKNAKRNNLIIRWTIRTIYKLPTATKSLR